jgi:hypothetical protein
MNIVNLMSNIIWSESDILSRTEDMIASRFSTAATVIMNRKVTAAMLGQYTLTTEEELEVQAYSSVCEAAAIAGNVARTSMVLLRLVLKYESAKQRLSIPEVLEPKTIEVEGVEETNPALAVDLDERNIAQAVVNEAAVSTLDLVLLRNPVPPKVDL